MIPFQRIGLAGVLGLLALCTAIGGCASSAAESSSQNNVASEDTLLDRHIARLREVVAGPVDSARPQVMVLGTFHLANPGADAHKSKYTFDVFSEDGQRQLGEVLDRLEAFRPTKILVERNSDLQAQVDEWYASYLAGKQEKVSNEIVTIGFALAKRLGHERVYAFDADGVWLPTVPTTREAFAEAARRIGKADALDDPVYARYSAMYKECDEIEETLTLRQRLRLLNHPEYVRLGHGSYFFWNAFRASDGKEFPGPDGFISMWHNRNIRMFANVQRLASEPNDRVLVIVGAGHVPILRQCVLSCPTLDWVPVDDYLRVEAK